MKCACYGLTQNLKAKLTTTDQYQTMLNEYYKINSEKVILIQIEWKNRLILSHKWLKTQFRHTSILKMGLDLVLSLNFLSTNTMII